MADTKYLKRLYVKNTAAHIVYVHHILGIKPNLAVIDTATGFRSFHYAGTDRLAMVTDSLDRMLSTLLISCPPDMRAKLLETDVSNSRRLAAWWLGYLKKHPELGVEVLDDAG